MKIKATTIDIIIFLKFNRMFDMFGIPQKLNNSKQPEHQLRLNILQATRFFSPSHCNAMNANPIMTPCNFVSRLRLSNYSLVVPTFSFSAACISLLGLFCYKNRSIPRPVCMEQPVTVKKNTYIIHQGKSLYLL